MENKKITLTQRKILNILFVIWFSSELFLQYTVLSKIMMVLFCISIIFFIKKIKITSYMVCSFVFIVLSLINMATNHSIDRDVSFSMTITLVTNLIFISFFIQYYLYINDIKEIFTLICGVVAVYSVVCILLGFPSLISYGRMQIDGINVNTAAYYAVYACLWSVYSLLYVRKKEYSKWILILIYSVFIIMTGSRGAFFSILIGMYVLFVLQNKRTMVLKSILVIAIVILVLIAIMNIDYLYHTIGYRIAPIFDFFLKGSYEEASLESRLGYSELAFSKISENLFWGHGLDCFRCVSGSYGTYSHNNYAEILFSLGIPGVVVYYYPFLFGLKKTKRKVSQRTVSQRTDVILWCVICLLIYFISEPFRVTYFNRAFLIIPIMCQLYVTHYNDTRVRI